MAKEVRFLIHCDCQENLFLLAARSFGMSEEVFGDILEAKSNILLCCGGGLRMIEVNV